MSPYRAIKEECCESNRVLPGLGLVDLTFGNVSVFDPALGVFGIKPSGVDYAQLRPDDIVIVDLDLGFPPDSFARPMCVMGSKPHRVRSHFCLGWTIHKFATKESRS